MRSNNFDHKIEVLQRRLDELQRRTVGGSAWLEELLPEALEELRLSLEEFLVADEELRQQNEELVTTQETLEAERQRYRELFDFAPDGYLVTDPKGIIQEANRAAAALLSAHQDYFIGKPLIVFVAGEEDRKTFHTQLARLRRLEQIGEWELRLKPHKGVPFHAAITVAVVRNSHDKLVGLRWSIRDITERKQTEEALHKAHDELDELEVRVQEQTVDLVKTGESLQAEIAGRSWAEGALRESEQQYRNLFENVPTGIYRTTPDGRVLMSNPALVQMLGYSSSDDIASRNLEDEGFYIDYTRGQFKELVEREGEVRGLEHKWIKRDGATILVRENARAVRGEDGTVLYYEGTVEDITERRQTEEALRESFIQLSKKNRYDGIISAVTRSVHQSANLQDVLENAVESMSKNIDGVDNVFISLVEGQEAVLKTHRGYPDWFIERVRRIPYPKGATWRVITEGKPLYCADADNDTFIGPAGREVGTKSYVSMPIFSGGKAVGVININSLEKNAFDEEELKLLETVAQQIEIAINNARQAELLYRANEELEMRVRERTQSLYETNEELRKEIAWRKKAEKALRDGEERYRALYEENPSMYFTVDGKGKILSVNQFGAEQLGYTAQELIGQSVLDISYKDDKESVLGRLNACLQNHGQIARWEFRKVCKDGSVVWMRESGRTVRGVDGNIVALITCEDITERKRAEEQIKASLKEKEVLLREIHHRVKNNLQVISSLLRLRSVYIKEKRIEGKQIMEIFNETENRVQSMALIHEILYQSKDLSSINFNEYIRNLTTHLFYSYTVKSKDVKLKIKIDDISLGVDRAISCGLIINELVSNSLKHAFPKGKEGEIRIELRPYNGRGDSSGRPYTLVVGDNGVGFPKDLDFRNTESLGLQLVTSLVKKLRGTIEFDRSNGTEFKIVFSL